MIVKVCDAICGAGKTRSCIHMMNTRLDSRFLFVTPYLDEVDRIVKECASREFISPSQNGTSKRDDILELLLAGRNIATTHALFRKFDEDIKNVIRDLGYIMVLDEVVDLFQPSGYSPQDVNALERNGLIRIEGDDVIWLDEQYEGNMFKEIVDISKSNNLKLYDDKLMFWSLPIDLFLSFREVYVLTYMYEYQMLNYFLKSNHVDYELIGTKKVDGVYLFCPANEMDRRVDLRDKIHIIDNDKANEIGSSTYALSSGWFHRAEKEPGQPSFEILRNNIYNALRCPEGSNNRMWTTLNKYRQYLHGKGYSNSFICFNKRASNDFANRHYLAYCLNVYMFPWMKNYLARIGADNVNQDMYALSILIQWVFRSAVRRGEKVKIYIPSKRMRYLLKKWIANLYEGKDLTQLNYRARDNMQIADLRVYCGKRNKFKKD